MQSQLYFTGKLVAQPELLQTKNGKTMVRLLLETELVRPTAQGGFQAEAVILPVSFFSREAETVKDCHRGDSRQSVCTFTVPNSKLLMAS
jgi:single-stranded DNA-binding protein